MHQAIRSRIGRPKPTRQSPAVPAPHVQFTVAIRLLAVRMPGARFAIALLVIF